MYNYLIKLHVLYSYTLWNRIDNFKLKKGHPHLDLDCKVNQSWYPILNMMEVCALVLKLQVAIATTIFCKTIFESLVQLST